MKRLVADSLRTLEVLQQIPEIDPQRIILRGGSQGGGIALLVNALTNVPILRRLPMCQATPILSIGSNKNRKLPGDSRVYRTISETRETIYQVMSYFDLKYFAHQITGPVYTSVGSADPICPMEDFFVSYKRFLDRKNCVFT